MPLQGEDESRTSWPPKEAMDKSLKVGEDEWRERERRGTKFMPQIVEAMSSKVILMMPKNQELSKVSSKDSRIKFQVSRFMNQDLRKIKIKIQESREDSINISTKFFFKTLSCT